MEVIKLNSWEEFVQIFENFDLNQRKFIFRGHSNSIDSNGETEEWKLHASYYRSNLYSSNFQEFFVNQADQFYDSIFSNYHFDKSVNLKELSPLERCYFFQHYGIPTCFIDFTFDPLVALYFSLTGVPSVSKNCDNNFITIYSIDIERLIESLQIKEISKENFTYDQLDQFLIGPAENFIALDLNPLSNCRGDFHYNIKYQKACFIFYDVDPNTTMDKEFPLDEYVETIEKLKQLPSSVVKYQISLNSLYKSLPDSSENRSSLFNYLENKKRTGRYLFNDIQGLKYDLNWLHQL